MFICSFCKYKAISVRKYDLHLYLHRNCNGFFKCKHGNCFMVFRTYSGFHSHVNRIHFENETSLKITKNINVSEIFKCLRKGCEFSSRERKQFNSHIYTHINRNEYLHCPFKNLCGSSIEFKSIPVIRNHFLRKHKYHNSNNDNKKQDLLLDYHSDNQIGVDELLNVPGGDVSDYENPENCKDMYLKLLSLLYITLESKHFSTKKSLQVLIESLSDAQEINLKFLNAKLTSEYGLNTSENYLIQNDLFLLAHHKQQGQLSTNFLREKYYKKHFYYIAPQKMSLTSDNETSFFYYVPILKTIETLLKLENVWK